MSDKISKTNSNFFYYGTITNLNIQNRLANSVIGFKFPIDSTPNPFVTAEGFGYLFVNQVPDYGIQIVISNQGIAARQLSSGVYGDWKFILQF